MPSSAVRASVFSVLVVLAGLGLPAAARAQAGQYSQADRESGGRIYNTQCFTCHGPDGDAIPGIDLRKGQFRRVSTDDDIKKIVSTGIPGTAMPGLSFTPAQLTAIVAYLRSGFSTGSDAPLPGDAGRGRALFEGKGGCMRCHRVNGNGSRVAPDLSEAGVRGNSATLQRRFVDPTSTMRPINRPVRAVTRDGKVVAGRRLNEDTHSVQLIDSTERLVSLVKSDLREFQIMTTSPMPSFKDTLNSAEQTDIIAYLLSLKGLK